MAAGNLWHDCCKRNLNYACEGVTAGKFKGSAAGPRGWGRDGVSRR